LAFNYYNIEATLFYEVNVIDKCILFFKLRCERRLVDTIWNIYAKFGRTRNISKLANGNCSEDSAKLWSYCENWFRC